VAHGLRQQEVQGAAAEGGRRRRSGGGARPLQGAGQGRAQLQRGEGAGIMRNSRERAAAGALLREHQGNGETWALGLLLVVLHRKRRGGSTGLGDARGETRVGGMRRGLS
jgi:hypothetical protein